MSEQRGIYGVTYFVARCDGCGTQADFGDYSAMATVDQVEDELRDSEWTTDGTLWHCCACPSLKQCDRCEKPMPYGDGEQERCESCVLAASSEPSGGTV